MLLLLLANSNNVVVVLGCTTDEKETLILLLLLYCHDIANTDTSSKTNTTASNTTILHKKFAIRDNPENDRTTNNACVCFGVGRMLVVAADACSLLPGRLAAVNCNKLRYRYSTYYTLPQPYGHHLRKGERERGITPQKNLVQK